MRTAYKCRAYPTPEQAVVLNRTFGCVRVVWNRTLAWRHARYHTEGQRTGYRESDAHLTAMKKLPELAWLAEVSSVPLQQTLRHQHTAFVNFFAGRARYPRYKSRLGKQAATYTRSAFRMRDGGLLLAKTSEPLPFVWTWPEAETATIDPSMVTVSRDAAGRWFVTFQLEVPAPTYLAPTGAAVGVDLGLKDFAVLSTGEKIAHPRHMDRREQRLKRYQRMMARKRKGSNNRAKARVKVARAHAKVTDARRDFLHKTSTTLVRRYDMIAVEDLNVSGMVRNRRLAKSISRTGWAEFRSVLDYKSARYGRRLVVMDRWYPSSKTCSACGHLLAVLRLDTRHWTCPGCGALHDRDVNAAKDILTAGLAGVGSKHNADHACGADVRRQRSSVPRLARKQESSSARVRIPVL